MMALFNTYDEQNNKSISNYLLLMTLKVHAHVIYNNINVILYPAIYE